MLLSMGRDNLTEELSLWKDGGASQADLSAPTLYRDILNGALDSDSVIDSLTAMVQMFQGNFVFQNYI